MSIIITTAMWRFSAYRGVKLIVLLALADWADDEGVCWPSILRIAEKARVTERGAQKIMRHLLEDGVIDLIEPGGGRGYPRTYRIKGENHPAFNFLKGECEGPKTLRVETARGNRFSVNQKTKGEPGGTRWVNAGTIKDERSDIAIRKEPSFESSSEPSVDLPDWISFESWSGFVKMRKAIRRPLTPQGAKLLIAKLGRFRAAGHDPVVILDESTMNDWQGVYLPRQRGSHAEPRKTAREIRFDEAREYLREVTRRKTV